MFVHLGAGVSVKSRDIVAIFDLETSTLSKNTRRFVARAEKEMIVTDVCEGMPKSFVVWESNGERRVYVSKISSRTLMRRMESDSLEED